MRHIIIFLVFGCLFRMDGFGQTEEDSVKIAVNRLFIAMKNSDARGLKESFTDSAILQSLSKNKEGNFIIEDEKIQEFIDIVSKLPAGDADERIQFETIKIDGPLAFVWAPYKFYYKAKFIHCGVDSFQLVKINGTWKIQILIDTRRKENCE
jgi:Putative lumazine-binding